MVLRKGMSHSVRGQWSNGWVDEAKSVLIIDVCKKDRKNDKNILANSTRDGVQLSAGPCTDILGHSSYKYL